ncbi:ABC transporter ATP-binding protein [Sulfitobacter sp.]|uniref:ABC transporter ATP-binding protein n=1 Tax=Sulfitobacter sp. TaxID=1903071 RepID=UPI00300341ED
MTKLQISNLRKTYGGFTAVHGLDLEIEEGETVALLGPSGCGKSTTLNMIVGLTEPTAGDIRIDGKSVIGTPPGQRGIGLVFQDYAVFGNMTVRQNLAFGLKVRKLSKSKIQEEVEKTADLLGLSSTLDDATADMGGSQLQRVALGRTLITNPSILLLDEPLSNLEAAMRNEMRQELRRIQKKTGQTVIYVTHDQIEALSLAHKIAVMEQGRLVQYGDTYDVYHYPQETFVGGFLGNPPMNFLKGKIVVEKSRSFFETGQTRMDVSRVLPAVEAQNGRSVTLGIRPESIQISEAPTGVSAQLTLVEQIGADTVLSADLEGQEMRILTTGLTSLNAGDECHLTAPAGMISIFEPTSGVRLDTASQTQGQPT